MTSTLPFVWLKIVSAHKLNIRAGLAIPGDPLTQLPVAPIAQVESYQPLKARGADLENLDDELPETRPISDLNNIVEKIGNSVTKQGEVLSSLIDTIKHMTVHNGSPHDYSPETHLSMYNKVFFTIYLGNLRAVWVTSFALNHCVNVIDGPLISMF